VHTSTNEFLQVNSDAFVRTHKSRNAICICTLVQIENIIHTVFVQMILFDIIHTAFVRMILFATA